MRFPQAIDARAFALGAIALALGGCAAPPYKPAADAPLAMLDLRLVGKEASVCIAGKMYSLVPDKDGIAKIPGDAPVDLFRFYYFSESGGNITYTWSCGPAIGFDSVKGQTYVLDGFAGDGTCHLEVYRAAPDTPIGVAIEPSVRGFYCPKPDAPPDRNGQKK